MGIRGQGLFEGSYYRIRSEARRALPWLFANIDEAAGERLGDFGLCGGGAAGFELDRADPALGTPSTAVLVASSEGTHSDHFVAVFEELLTHYSTVPGVSPQQLVRADIVFYELPVVTGEGRCSPP